jgi:hypothetical protein
MGAVSYRSSLSFTAASDQRPRVVIERNRWSGQARVEGLILWRPSVGAAIDAALATFGMPTDGIVFEVKQ